MASENSSADTIDIRAWPIVELVGTLVARIALLRRGAIEADPDADVYELETDRYELEAWARMELTAWLKPQDFAILEATIGSLTDDQLERCENAAIQASTIAWAVNVVTDAELPVFGDGTAEDTALDWTPGPWTPVRNVLGSLRIRSDEALARERERWELVAWRLALPRPLDHDSTLALVETVEEIASVGIISVSQSDLVTDGGVRFDMFDDADLPDFLLEAEIRLRTLNWICGLGDDIDTTPLFPDD